MPEDKNYIDASTKITQFNNPQINKIIDDGYKLFYEICTDDRLPDDTEIHIQIWKDDEIAGGYSFIDNGCFLYPNLTNMTIENYRRKGLAKAAYCFAENYFNKSIIPDRDSQTDDAKAFWNMPNRPFGNPNNK